MFRALQLKYSVQIQLSWPEPESPAYNLSKELHCKKKLVQQLPHTKESEPMHVFMSLNWLKISPLELQQPPHELDYVHRECRSMSKKEPKSRWNFSTISLSDENVASNET